MQNTNPSIPTIVLYKTADQITRVVASQAVRVIILDADGADLDEESSRVIQLDDQSLVVTDLQVSGTLGSSPQSENAVDAGFVQAVEKVVAELPAGGLVNYNVPGQLAEPFPIVRSVQVKHWNCYGLDSTVMTHQIDIDDQRVTTGQVYLAVGALEGDVDEMLSVIAEVNTNPLTGIEQLPCLHVGFDSDATAFSLFKLKDKILLRNDTGVCLTPLAQSSVSYPAGMNDLGDYFIVE